MYPIAAPVLCIDPVHGLEVPPYLAGSFLCAAEEEGI